MQDFIKDSIIQMGVVDLLQECNDNETHFINSNKKYMAKIQLALTSKVFWTVVIMVAIAVVPVIKDYLSPTVFGVVEAVLGVLASYFNVNPTPAFTAKLKKS